MKKQILAASCLAMLAAPSNAQNAFTRAMHKIGYRAEAQVTAGSDDTPLWLTANRYGLSSIDGSNGYLRAAVHHDARCDSAYKWRIGYGADVAVAYGFTSTAVVQQLYADFDYKLVRLTLGAKEQPMALKNQELSSGSQTFGINSRPVPQVRIGLPEYWNISGRDHWAAIRGYIAYGMQTDGRFQEDYVAPGQLRNRHVLYHAKAGYLKLGNEEKFPLTFEGGLEMATQFGGTIYNAVSWDGILSAPLKQPHGLGDFIDATFGGGGDATDGEGYANSTGNTVGSWLFRLNYKGRGWGAAVYYDHFFEDHSQMFWEYGWRDGLIGVELSLPRNRFLTTAVYEFMKTTYQSGPVYHDATEAIPDQISGQDNYYNHGLYTGWLHWGQANGNPLYVSPLYNHNGKLDFTSNRFRAHHIGLSGDPLPSLHWRLLYSYERSYGLYTTPFEPSRTTHSLLVEARYAPARLGKAHAKGWSFAAAWGLDRGTLIGDNCGFRLTVAKSGLLVK